MRRLVTQGAAVLVAKQSQATSLIGPVLVATDLTPASDEALRQADALARALGGPLHVCHVIPHLLTVRMLFPQAQRRDDAVVRELEHYAGDLVQASIAKLTGRALGELRVGIESDSPHSRILRRAETMGAGIIAVGPGSVAERVVRHAHCPVLVARASARGAVLSATDFSDGALPALTAGAAEAARRGVALVVLHSLDLEPMTATVDWGVYAVIPLEPEEERRIRAEALDGLRRALESVGAEGETIVADGAPGPAIVAAARALPAQPVRPRAPSAPARSRGARISRGRFARAHGLCSCRRLRRQSWTWSSRKSSTATSSRS
jgi:nucleotide-binding universal stress UspA family protein